MLSEDKLIKPAPMYSSKQACTQIVSFCANIYQLLGEDIKSDFYKWLLCIDLRNLGLSYQMCGVDSKCNIYTDIMKIDISLNEPIYIILRTDSSIQSTEQLSKIYAAHYLQPEHSVIVNFGHHSFEFSVI